jgi:CheY-like chemotaxis protein
MDMGAGTTGLNGTGDADARKIFQLVWKEVRRYGAEEVTFFFEDSTVAYRFLSADGRAGDGTVNGKFTNLLAAVLQRSYSLQIGSESLTVVCSGARVFKLSLIPRKSPGTPPVKILPFSVPASLSPEEKGLPVKRELSVLVVEDNQTFAKVLVRFLERNGFAVTHAVDAHSALERLSSGFRPALIISDLHMPDLNGDEFGRRVRANELLARTPLMLLTSDRALETELAALQAGADVVLAKSEDPRIIVGYLRRFIARGEQGDATVAATQNVRSGTTP